KNALKRFLRKYITSRPLWFNILIGVALVVSILFLFAISLDWITQHGVALTVPAVTGKKLGDVQELLEDKGFEVMIQDSVYYDSLPPGMIIKQVPEAEAVVKKNRAIFVTVNRVLPPEIEMPNLIGPSFRNAEMVLRNLGLKLGDTAYRPDFARNSVLEQLYNGQPVKPGTKIRVGSKISLVVGSGLGTEAMRVPKLIGLTYTEAKILLDVQGINLGAVLPDPLVKNIDTAYVYKQSPMPDDEQGRKFLIRPGQMIDIWLSVEKPNVDSLNRIRRRPAPVEEEEEL
ncbi:MAG: PASTA domain-containing protein, partial [Bacteroidota bacterium]|nr:PASTA domain-containing protein [Bacteroidota bacterium]